MARKGECEKCGKKRALYKHHIVPRRSKKLLKKLFPEKFNGEKNIDLLCYGCHQGKKNGVEEIIPRKCFLLPKYYRKLNQMFLDGIEITEEQLNDWKFSSTAEIETSKNYLENKIKIENFDFLNNFVQTA